MSSSHGPVAVTASPGLRLTRLAIVSIVIVIASAPLRADGLAARLEPLLSSHEGQVAVAVKHLDTGVEYRHRADVPLPTASLIKFPVMIEAYRQAEAGQLDLAKVLTLTEQDKVPGSGILTPHFTAGATLTLRDAIRLMIAFSDNTATNLVVAQIGLPATAKTMEDLGCPETKLHSFVYRRETSIFPERSQKFGLGSTTAGEMLSLLERLHARTLVSPAASDAMREHLRACDDKLKFKRLLPAGTKLAHKTGSVDASRTDAGIIESPSGPIALCVLTTDNADKRWVDDNAGDLLCARIAQQVFEFFAAETKAAAPAPCGLVFDADEIVEDAESDDAADEEDGDAQVVPAGAVIEAAAKSSTAGNSLPPLEPRDSLSGTPFVSCRNWIVADAGTGTVLANRGAADVVDVASTTKIMTAYLVLQLAQKEPELLDQAVTFSERAAATSGSSCDLKAGDKLPVRELLYGLLLPSGNDAAVALAEHFGKRFEPASSKSAVDGLSRFVAEMNRTARRLEMSATRYLNPNGLPEKGHMSSARDLARLTVAARKDKLFRTIVATRRHEAQATTREGKPRSVAWKNTNKLLAVTGYSGVKTGYTRAAGSCLVSSGERGQETLIVVVLGAPSSAAAVADSRNLYRWAWKERGQRE